MSGIAFWRLERLHTPQLPEEKSSGFFVGRSIGAMPLGGVTKCGIDEYLPLRPIDIIEANEIIADASVGSFVKWRSFHMSKSGIHVLLL